jgi:DNA-binding NarL/FixJ family response regulator
LKKLTILHYHEWADHSELLNTSIQKFSYFNVQLKHVHGLDQHQIDLFADASSSPIVIVDIDLVSAEIIEKIANLIREKSPICIFVLTADKRTKEYIKLLDLELCGYLSLQDFSAHALEQSMAFVHRIKQGTSQMNSMRNVGHNNCLTRMAWSVKNRKKDGFHSSR